MKPLDHIPAERVLAECLELLETLDGEREDAYDWTPAGGGVAYVDLDFYRMELRNAIKHIKAITG